MKSFKIPERLIAAVCERTFVPFIGSGFSKQADKVHFPNWTELLKRLIISGREAGYLQENVAKNLLHLLSGNKHLMVAESLKSKLPTDFYNNFLESEFDPPDIFPSKAHSLLFDLNPKLIITTNYDRLIENAYASKAQRSLTVIPYSDSATVQRRLQDDKYRQRPFLYKIHGDIEDVSSIILSENDYRKLLYDQLGYQTVLSSIFIHYTVLFMGFSFSDEELSLLLGKLRYALKGSANPDYILLQEHECNPVEAERFRCDYGLEVISYPNHDCLKDILLDIKTKASKKEHKK